MAIIAILADAKDNRSDEAFRCIRQGFSVDATIDHLQNGSRWSPDDKTEQRWLPILPLQQPAGEVIPVHPRND